MNFGGFTSYLVGPAPPSLGHGVSMQNFIHKCIYTCGKEGEPVIFSLVNSLI